jgi:predicted RNA-binding protein associated with RNAse of E/G family
MANEQIIATWISFMGTAIKKSFALSHEQFALLAKQYRLIQFLFDNYELLHYYDTSYIVEDVKRYIAEQGGTINA